MRLGTQSNYDPSQVCPYLQPLVSADGVHPPDTNWTLGTSADPLPVTAGTPVMDWEFDSASTSGSTSVQPFKTKMTMSGASGVGGRVMHHMYTNVGLGGWANALKAYTEFGASGSVSGLGSAVLAEMKLSAGTSSGTYAPFEGEIVMPSSASVGTATSFMYFNVSGTDASTFEDNGYLFQLGSGFTVASGNLVQAETDETKFSHKIRCDVNGTTLYLMACDS